MNSLPQLSLALHTVSPLPTGSFRDGTSNTVQFGEAGRSSLGTGHGQGNANGHSNPHNPHCH